MKFKDFNEIKKELLKDPDVKKEYDRLEPKFDLIRSIIEKRIEKNISQKELASRMGTKQSALSRFESGNYNPSLDFMQKVAQALDLKLEIKLR
jgi:ribosome-binding protein aMBF1 (putative translation factor)